MDDVTIKQWSAGPRCTVAESAELLSTSPQTVRRMVRLGQLIAWRPNPQGRKLLLYRRQVESLAVSVQARAVSQARLLQTTFNFYN